MPEFISAMNIKIPEACTQLCFGDVIRMNTQEKKCLTNCFEQHRNSVPRLLNYKREDRDLIF